MEAIAPILLGAAKDIIGKAGKAIPQVIKEFETPEGESLALDQECNRQQECSNTGLPGGPLSPAIGGDVGCCPDGKGKKTCQFKRPDYLGIKFCPGECKEGLFATPGSCKPSLQELEARDKLKTMKPKKREKEFVKEETLSDIVEESGSELLQKLMPALESKLGKDKGDTLKSLLKLLVH